ncbi:hypothetical protein [Escherichia phage ZCEC13]|uniref:Uncharacterized protein n=1 Tax=Escherichia phage ZCEC13 TaxID=2935866 RepID=A0AAE9KT89_9CAUD|nr:hypothetical protein [Escherichia phage ZCEC13]
MAACAINCALTRDNSSSCSIAEGIAAFTVMSPAVKVLMSDILISPVVSRYSVPLTKSSINY